MNDLRTNVFEGLLRLTHTNQGISKICATICTALFLAFGQSLPAFSSTTPGSGANQMPVGVTDIYTIEEDTPFGANVLDNDYDPEGDPMHTVAEDKATAHGHVKINTDGTFTYTPEPNYNGEDTFTYSPCDVVCCHGNVKITVTPKQDKPVGAPDTYSTNEDTKLDVIAANGVLKNDTDADGEPITAVLRTTTQHGTLVLNPNGAFTYTPNLNYNGNDSFTYYANDGTDNSAATLVTITVVPVNDPPIAVNDAISTNEDISVNIPVLANDTDVDNALTGSMIIIVTTPIHGTAAVNVSSGKVKYTPALNYYGNDSFTYKLKDPGGAFSNVATVAITVIPVNDAPIAAPDQATTPEDVAVEIPVLVNDTDVDNLIDPTSVTIKTNPSHGSVVVNPSTGVFTYTPAKDYYGTDSFTYTVKDVGGAISQPATVTIVVTPVNDAPIAVNDAATTNENTPVGIPVLANDIDVDSPLNPASITIGTTTQHGTLSINTTTGIVTYTPTKDYTGNDSFTYKIKDSAGAFSNVATVAITVNFVNDAPIAAPDQTTTPEDVAVEIPVLANDTDVDNFIDPTSVTVKTNPSHGSVVVNPLTGVFTYTPAKDYYGTDSFTYTVEDVGGAISQPATVTIVVTPVNDAPIAVNDAATTDENTAVGIPVLANDIDVDSPLNPASITIGTTTQHGTLSINTTTGIVTYTPTKDYAGNDSFTYTIKDSGGLISNIATVSITVVAVNLPPIAVNDFLEHHTIAPVSIDVMANDYDPDNAHSELTIISVTNPSKGSVSIVNGKIVYTPEGTSASTVTFSYTISDPGGLTDDAVVTINYTINELIVSQGFSPNGDGNNDTWFIKGIEGYPNNIVKVYDRWGLQVYQKSGYENTIAPWDGRGNVGQMAGKLVDRGTYFYTLEPGGGLKRLEGYVVVIR